jgi:hypothetical protein
VLVEQFDPLVNCQLMSADAGWIPTPKVMRAVTRARFSMRGSAMVFYGGYANQAAIFVP